MTDADLDRLDRLLREVGQDPLVVALSDRAASSGHVSAEVFDAFRAESLPLDEMKNVRRHLLFCNTCAGLVLALGGELPDEPAVRGPGEAADDSGRAGAPLTSRRTALLICGVASFLVVAAFIWSMTDRKAAPEPDGAPRSGATLGLEVHSMASDARVADGVLGLDEAFRLDLTAPSPMRTFAYVLQLRADGRLSGVEPPAGGYAAARSLRPTATIPSAPEGWTLRGLGLQSGREVALIVILSNGRINVLEGEMRDGVTLPRLVGEPSPLAGALAITLPELERRILALLPDVSVVRTVVRARL